MTASATLTELLALEHAGWKSLSDGSGDRFYGDVMADDGLMVLANGAVMDRAAVVQALGQSPRWSRYEIEEPRLIVIDADAAAVVYRGTGWRSDSDEPFVGAMSSVYRRDGGQWKLALYQQTTVAS